MSKIRSVPLRFIEPFRRYGQNSKYMSCELEKVGHSSKWLLLGHKATDLKRPRPVFIYLRHHIKQKSGLDLFTNLKVIFGLAHGLYLKS